MDKYKTTISLLFKGLFNFYCGFLLLLLFSNCSKEVQTSISLAGEWNLKLDSLNVGEKEGWAKNKIEDITISIPGTLDDSGIGKPNTLEPALNNYVLSNLTRKHQYIGKAWYQKEVEIPSNWEDKSIELLLERVIWKSTVYIDGERIDSKNSLIGKHQYDLTKKLSTGKHLLTVVIDNSNIFPTINVKGDKYPDTINQDMAHAYTNHTQIKWNGILGKISLTAKNTGSPKNLQIYPDLKEDNIEVTFFGLLPKEGDLKVEILDLSGKNVVTKTISDFKTDNDKVSFLIDKPTSLVPWDEFNPVLYTLRVKTNAGTAAAKFGYREIEKDNGVLTLNGNRIFLRGNLECAIFPLTGHPPLDKGGWDKLIGQAKNYGLNHLRFHSWCPPRAAFEAADEAGFYLQVELPHWSLHFGEDKKATKFLKEEAYKVIEDYGNHPSFIFMAMGNELQGDIQHLNTMVADLKELDKRHLYATTAFSFQKPTGTLPEPQDDFFITQWTDKGWIRGQGIFNSQYPNFNKDYSENSDHIKTPLISHEIGQYSVYPDISEIPNYKGVLEPLNFIAIKNDLEKKGMLSLAADFTNSSGKLATILYKEEIERALKTSSFDGFQLLQLQDFPGQGTALVGLLNAFWESKGVVSAEEFSEFNSELVPLIRFEKAVYETGEQFKAQIEIANFYEVKENEVIAWTITDDNGEVLKRGSIKDVNLHIGNNEDIGLIEYAIKAEKAQKLNVSVGLKDSKYKNSWHIWGYPKKVMTASNNIVITSSMEAAKLALEQGKKVLLNPDFNTLKGIEGRFVPVFWSPVHFPNQPATMGLLVDDTNTAFNEFPTDSYTDWQWWDLCINSKSVITDAIEVTPLVRVIDNFVTNHNLSNLFEAKVGEGELIFSSIDLISDIENRPVARQLRYSLLKYMESESFNPSKEIEFKDLEDIKLQDKKNTFSTTDIYK
ncbi:sugar-binding domain-containing protein [Joostella sp.]|uniref:sugar-binding domain-containing protein n=1 Tax=Joostella sp. TaxID=2231138 RepID=UPI003A93CFAD